MDLELNEQSVGEYAKHSQRQSKDLKDQKSKVRNLERSLSQIVRDFERERDRIISQGRQVTLELCMSREG